MDLEGIQRAWGGPVAGQHPDAHRSRTPCSRSLDDYEPYQQAPYAGDVEAAKAEMKQSKYDTDQDGLCDAPAVQGRHQHQPQLRPLVVDVADHRAVRAEDRHHDLRPVRRRARRSHDRPARRAQDPVQLGHRLGQGLRRPVHVHGAVRQPADPPEGNTDYSLVGHHGGEGEGGRGGRSPPAASRAWTPTSTRAPPLIGQERTDCWVALDKKLMEEVVPWVPLIDATNIDLIGPAVTKYEYDQFGTEMAPGRTSPSTRPCRSKEEDEPTRRVPAPGWRHPGSRRSPIEPLMGRYIIRRLIYVVIVVLAVTLIAFLIFFVLPTQRPGRRVRRPQPTPELVAAGHGAARARQARAGAVPALHQAPRDRRRVRVAGTRPLVQHPIPVKRRDRQARCR